MEINQVGSFAAQAAANASYNTGSSNQSPAAAQQAGSSDNNLTQSTADVVKLSAEAQALNQVETPDTTVQRSANQVVETPSASGIDFIKGESKGGTINTFA